MTFLLVARHLFLAALVALVCAQVWLMRTGR
jgi:hypothetical protein